MASVKNILSKYGMTIIVGVAILAVLVWTFMVPFKNMNNVKGELKVVEQKYNDLKAKAVDEGQLLQNLNDAKAELAAYDLKFPPAIEQEETLRIVHSLEEETGFKMVGMTYDAKVPLQYDTLNQTASTAKSGSAAQPATSGVTPPVPGKGMKMPINTQFTANYAQLKDFVTKLNELEQKVGLREIKMTTDKDGTIKGSVILEFYGFAPTATPTPAAK